MPTDYEKIYRQSRYVLGAPTRQFVAFFDTYANSEAWVLDVGCGQGRDALFIARLGHSVVGVDIAPSAIRQLREDAREQNLPIEAEVCDIREYVPQRSFDVIVIDRTLHMLAEDKRSAVLGRLLHHTSEYAAVLIADERSNIAAFAAIFAGSEFDWSPIHKSRGYLFMRRIG